MCLDFSNLELVFKEVKKIPRTRSRPNVSGVDKDYCDKSGINYNGNVKNKKGKRRVSIGHLTQSITFGKSKVMFEKNGVLKDSRWNDKFPIIYNALRDWIDVACPNLIYNSICLNHNLKCEPHVDGKNVGISLIVGFGDYEGGEIIVDGVKFDIFHKPLVFNGSQLIHSTADFSGNRWTAVFFLKV
jgi:hypothetical protein